MATRCEGLQGNPKQHCWLQNTWYIELKRWNCTMHDDKITSQSWLKCSKNNSIRNISLKTWVISRRSTGSSQKYSKIWAPQFLKLCENSAKHQRLHCFSVTEIGFLCCSCVFTSIPGFVIKKNSSRGPKHGQSERQIMFLQGEEDAQESETVKARPTWKILMKDVDLGEPTSFLDHVHLCCTQRECQISKDIVDNYRSVFRNKDFCLDYWKIQKQKPRWNLMQKQFLHGFFEIWKVMQRNAWRYCEFANKTTEQLFQVATPCMENHQFKEEENGSVVELIVRRLLTNCSEMSILG